MVQYRYWQSDADGWWYWHLLDSNGNIRSIGGQYFNSADLCVQDIREVHALVGGSYDIPINRIPDPNA